MPGKKKNKNGIHWQTALKEEKKVDEAKARTQERKLAKEQFEQELAKEAANAELDDDDMEERLAAGKSKQSEEAKKMQHAREMGLEMANREKIRRLDHVAESLLTVVRGLNIKEITYVIDAEKNLTHTILDRDNNVTVAHRAASMQVLWAFSFKGDDYKRRVLHKGGVDILTGIIDEFAPAAANPGNADAQLLHRNALAVLRSLATCPDCIPALIRLNITQRMILLLDKPQFQHEWPIALDMIATIASESKEERKRLQGPLKLLDRILGTPGKDERNFDGWIRTGLEDHALSAFRAIEAILTREEVRKAVLQNIRSVEMFTSVMDSESLDLKVAVCRIISRLCETTWCRDELKHVGLQDRICSAFCVASSAFARAATGVALASLLSSKDTDIAARAGPVAISIIREHKPTDTWDNKQLIVPAVLHVVRALARKTEMQDMIVSKGLVPQLVAIIDMDDSSPISREHAAHILGSVALQRRYHTNITKLLGSLPNLLEMVKAGSDDEKAAAARTLQYLTSYGGDFRVQVAEYKHVAMSLAATAADVWTGMSAVSVLVQAGRSPKCWEYGAGILRNMLGVEDIRQRVMRKPNNSDGVLCRLIAVCGQGSIPAKMHAAAALGNLCNTDERRTVVAGQGASRPLVQMLSGEGKDPDVLVGDMEFVVESRTCAARTLALLAYNESRCEDIISGGILSKLPSLICSKSAPLRLATSVALRNLCAYPSCSRQICAQPPVMEAVEKALRVDDEALQEHLTAAVANMAMAVSNVGIVLSARMCTRVVQIARKGTPAAKSSVAMLARYVGETMQPVLVQALVAQGIVQALVDMLELDVDVPGGPAQCAAGAFARMAAADERLAARCVDCGGLDGMVRLLESGCESAREQAGKGILIICQEESYRIVLLQLGGIEAARMALHKQEADAHLARQIIDLLTSTPFQVQKGTITDRKKAERVATRKAKVAQYWEEVEGHDAYDIKAAKRGAKKGHHSDHSEPAGSNSPVGPNTRRLVIEDDDEEDVVGDVSSPSVNLPRDAAAGSAARRVTFSREGKKRHKETKLPYL